MVAGSGCLHVAEWREFSLLASLHHRRFAAGLWKPRTFRACYAVLCITEGGGGVYGELDVSACAGPSHGELYGT